MIERTEEVNIQRFAKMEGSPVDVMYMTTFMPNLSCRNDHGALKTLGDCRMIKLLAKGQFEFGLRCVYCDCISNDTA